MMTVFSLAGGTPKLLESASSNVAGAGSAASGGAVPGLPVPPFPSPGPSSGQLSGPPGPVAPPVLPVPPGLADASRTGASGLPPRESPLSGGPGPDVGGPSLRWIDLVDPTPEECRQVSSLYEIPLEQLQAALDRNERPRLEQTDDVLLVVTRASLQESPSGRVPFATCPVGVILTPRAVVTVCLLPYVVADLLQRKLRGTGPHLQLRLALTLWLRISTTFIERLHHMDKRVEELERHLHSTTRNEELINMLHLEKSLIYFLTALKGNHSVLEKLAVHPRVIRTSAEQELVDDVLIENKQATDMAEIYSQVLGSLGDAFGTIVSNNLNKIMKLLTGLTIICTIPTIVGGVYGMNVPLPFQESSYAFAALLLGCLGVCVGLGVFFWKNDWL